MLSRSGNANAHNDLDDERRGQRGGPGGQARGAGHQTLVWERHRQVLRLRSTLREIFPAALEAFGDLAAPDTLERLAKAPGPAAAAGVQATCQVSGSYFVTAC